MNLEQQLNHIDQRLTEVLDKIDKHAPDEQDGELPHLELEPLLEQRQQLLNELLDSPLGQNPEWLQQILSQTHTMTTRAVVQLGQTKQRFGGYKKGRQQVNRYQQIEAGKG